MAKGPKKLSENLTESGNTRIEKGMDGKWYVYELRAVPDEEKYGKDDDGNDAELTTDTERWYEVASYATEDKAKARAGV